MKPRADDEDSWPMYLGIGSVNINEAPDDQPEPPSIWLPEHRSGSRFGGWKKRPFTAPTKRTLGFREPR